MRNKFNYVIVTIGFIVFLHLCAECESMNSFLLSKLVGLILLLVSYGLSKLAKTYNQINTINKTKSKNYESI